MQKLVPMALLVVLIVPPVVALLVPQLTQKIWQLNGFLL